MNALTIRNGNANTTWCYNTRRAPKHFQHFAIACIALNLVTFAVFAREGALANLYRQFLADGNSDMLVTFEREIITPKSQPTPTNTNLTPDATGRIPFLTHVFDKLYLTFTRKGSNFVIASSSRAPVTSEKDFLSADGLDGFDGESYWTLRLNNPVKVYRMPPSGDVSEIVNESPMESFNALTIIPRREALHKKTYQSDFALETIRGMETECLNVAQFGFENELGVPPQILGLDLHLKASNGQARIGRLAGDPNAPQAIEYRGVPGAKTLSVLLNYANDTITVRRSINPQPYFEARYRIVAAVAPSPLGEQAMFSWKWYKERSGQLISSLIKDGATYRVDITPSGEVQTRELMVKAKPISKKRPRLLIYVLFALVTAGAVILMFSRKNRPNNSTKGITV